MISQTKEQLPGHNIVTVRHALLEVAAELEHHHTRQIEGGELLLVDVCDELRLEGRLRRGTRHPVNARLLATREHIRV